MVADGGLRSGRCYDLLVIGGGINGAGIACDAAGRGLSVLLCEQTDLAAATSSASSKLIHGGLRYLEHGDFRLVREALGERDMLLAKAPHIVRPLRFILPHRRGTRPRWLVRAGLMLYDGMGASRRLPKSVSLDLRTDPAGHPLRSGLSIAHAYYDCQVDDARLVVLNAMAAARRGATVRTRTRVLGAERRDRRWQVHLAAQDRELRETVRTRAIVNAAGPWADKVREKLSPERTRNQSLRLVRGSHLVLPRLYSGNHAYLLQNDDGRVVFVIPFEAHWTLIGTTEVTIARPGGEARMDPAEADYLCAAVNRWFGAAISPEMAVWSYSGIRALAENGAGSPSAVSRDYALDLEAPEGGAPLLSVLGGKITTYRRLAEQTLARLRPFLPEMGPEWTADAPLPGGEIYGDFEVFADGLAVEFPALPREWLAALARRHGSLARDVLGDARGLGDLGRHFGAGLYAREVDYLCREEWARNAEDILWRRTKCGLGMSPAERIALSEALGDCETASVTAESLP